MSTLVYCDDAGFTGDNLLNIEQPFFAYSAVAVGQDAAAALLDEFRQRFDIQDAEIKGRIVYGRPYARDAIAWLINELGDRVSVAMSDKLFAIAAKFFEYAFEPVIARNSLFFYERGFHLHVANVVWAHLLGGDQTTRRIVDRFEELLRRRSGAPQIYFEDHRSEREGPIGTIQRFVHACRPTIQAELADLADESGRIKWVLDLSFSSAKSVLCTLGERFGELEVIFDDSKPLLAYRDFFDGFIGRTEIPYMTFRGRRAPLIFNLAGPVEFGSSATEAGLQIADLIASFSALAARDRRTERGAEILNICLPIFNDDSVWPDPSLLDLNRRENLINTLLLLELAERAEAGEDVLDGIAEYCDFIAERLELDPPPGLAFT